jgi:DNA-binding MarR family transcriptional regulator
VTKIADKTSQENGTDVADIVANGTVTSLKLEKFLPYRLTVLSSLVAGALSELYAQYGLNLNEWFVLTTLAQFGEMSAKAIGVRNRMHKTKVSRIVAALLERNLVSRRINPADLRQSVLHLTPLGKTLHEQCAPVAAEFVRRLEDGMPELERHAFNRGLTRLATQSEQMTDRLYWRDPS